MLCLKALSLVSPQHSTHVPSAATQDRRTPRTSALKTSSIAPPDDQSAFSATLQAVEVLALATAAAMQILLLLANAARHEQSQAEQHAGQQGVSHAALGPKQAQQQQHHHRDALTEADAQHLAVAHTSVSDAAPTSTSVAHYVQHPGILFNELGLHMQPRAPGLSFVQGAAILLAVVCNALLRRLQGTRYGFVAVACHVS